MSQIVALARNGLAAFFDWWLSELAGLVPRALQPTRGRRGLILAIGQAEHVLFQNTGGGRRLIGRAPASSPEGLQGPIRKLRAKRRQATVRLAPDQGLRKSLELPLAAKDDLNQLLRFEMDRLTPFRSDEVLFAHRITGIDGRERRINVDLQLAPKAVVESALGTASGLGLTPVRVELGGSDEAGAGLDLLPNAHAASAGTSRVLRALVLLAVVLAAAAVVIPLQQRRATIAELERQVAAAKAEAEESLALRERLEQVSASTDFLAAEKARVPMVSRILAEVTRVVPDQAYLARLDWRDEQLQLQGFAEASAALVGLLDSSPLFQTPQFRSPVTPDRRTGLERFHVSVQLAAGES